MHEQWVIGLCYDPYITFYSSIKTSIPAFIQIDLLILNVGYVKNWCYYSVLKSILLISSETKAANYLKIVLKS